MILYLLDVCLKEQYFIIILYDRPKKTDDTVVQLKDNTIVQIVKFVCIEKRYYMTVRKIVVSSIRESVPMLHFMKVIEKEKTQ